MSHQNRLSQSTDRKHFFGQSSPLDLLFEFTWWLHHLLRSQYPSSKQTEPEEDLINITFLSHRDTNKQKLKREEEANSPPMYPNGLLGPNILEDSHRITRTGVHGTENMSRRISSNRNQGQIEPSKLFPNLLECWTGRNLGLVIFILNGRAVGYVPVACVTPKPYFEALRRRSRWISRW